MATAFTHAFLAAAAAPLAPAEAPRGRVVVLLVFLSVAPDLDVMAFALGIPYEHPLGHRGFTHSFAFAGIVGLIAPWVVFPAVALGSAAWWRLVALCGFVTASHGILDAATDAGLGVGFLLPFHEGRFFWPWRPLATSPIGVQAFLNRDALRILANEALWVWLPASLLIFAWSALRRRRRRAA